MDEYQITFARSARRELQRLAPPIARRVLALIDNLGKNPRPARCVKLVGSRSDWRIRSGDWRIIYTIDDSKKSVDIAAIRHRSDAYR